MSFEWIIFMSVILQHNMNYHFKFNLVNRIAHEFYIELQEMTREFRQKNKLAFQWSMTFISLLTDVDYS